MLTSVLIHQHRSCRETEVLPHPGITALIGKNGAGKTSILKAIGWAASVATSTAGLEPGQFGPSANVVLEFTLPSGSYTYAVESRIDVPRPSKLYESLLLKESGKESRSLIFREGETVNYTGLTDSVKLNSSTPSLAALTALLPDHDLIQMHFMPVLKFLRGVKYLDIPIGADSHGDFITNVEYAKWLESAGKAKASTPRFVLELLHLWKNDREGFDRLQELIGSQGLSLLDEIIIGEHELGEEGKPNTIYVPMFKPSASMGGSNQRLFYSALSEGSKRLLNLVLHSFLLSYTVLLVEQPEDSLHSGILRKFIDLLRTASRNSQIIFSTHSIAPMDMLRPEELVFVTAHNGITKTRKLSQSELQAAADFLDAEGSLGEFVETVESDEE